MKKLKGEQITDELIGKLIVNTPSINQKDFTIYTVKSISNIYEKENTNKILLRLVKLELYDNINEETITETFVVSVYRRSQEQWNYETSDYYLMDEENSIELLNKIRKFTIVYELLKKSLNQ